jgi:hypothetical protein
MIVKVSIEVEVSDNIGTEAELEYWLKYCLNYRGRINTDNPYLKELGDLNPRSVNIEYGN